MTFLLPVCISDLFFIFSTNKMAHLLAISVIMSITMHSWGQEITIETQLGQITGMKRTLLVGNVTVYDFLKIPFAKAPIGDLRFEKPQPHGSWSDTLDAKTYGPSCYQNLDRNVKEALQNKNVSEDCLFLNIHVPFDVSSNYNKSVMVWIHGGGYSTGQAAVYDGAYLAATGDVIVVTISYRLNIFGFFSMGEIKGNYGLWDQIMAIQWVKDNIRSFGGNSQSITIFGESAGGFSAGLLSIIPTNRGLFHRAILQSGTAISTYTMSTITKTSSAKVALSLNCSQTDSSLLLKCLKDLNSDDLLVQASRKDFTLSLFAVPFAPVIDGDLLTDDPNNVLMDVKSAGYAFYRSLDIVIGTVSGESSLLLNIFTSTLQYILKFNSSDYIPGRIVCDVIAPDIALVDYKNNEEISNAICEKYGKVIDKTEQSLSVLDSYADFVFNIPMIKSLRAHAENENKNGKHYQYLFSRPSPFILFGPYPAWFTRAEHGSEIAFEFPFTVLGTEDFMLTTQFMKFWTHFATTG